VGCRSLALAEREDIKDAPRRYYGEARASRYWTVGGCKRGWLATSRSSSVIRGDDPRFGVAEMRCGDRVAVLRVRDAEAAGSNPAFPTRSEAISCIHRWPQATHRPQTLWSCRSLPVEPGRRRSDLGLSNDHLGGGKGPISSCCGLRLELVQGRNSEAAGWNRSSACSGRGLRSLPRVGCPWPVLRDLVEPGGGPLTGLLPGRQAGRSRWPGSRRAPGRSRPGPERG
jgi:hypothetical protein